MATSDPPAAPPTSTFLGSLVAGGAAGIAVDMSLFPLDTIKTRLQSSQGFWKAGGFNGIYRGLGAAAVGSAPGAGMFFSVYESTKHYAEPLVPQGYAPLVHMMAASVGETAACLVRVPTENIKQNLQAGHFPDNRTAVETIYRTQGLIGFYRGFLSTVLREVPFSFIQFPIYEKAKAFWSEEQGKPVTPLQAAACGSFAGSIAAAITTPLDVVKTRLILQKEGEGQMYKGVADTMQRMYREEGIVKLFSGLGPRVMWIGIGGFVFFGVYEDCRRWMRKMGL